jgi:predicted nucleic acid-binding protein
MSNISIEKRFMTKTRIFLDTNVLVYAHDTASQYHVDSANLLTKIIEGLWQGVLAEQTLIELYRILTNRTAMRNTSLSSAQAHRLIYDVYWVEQFQIIYPTESTLQKTLELAEQRKIVSAKIFDLRLAAVALSAEVDSFATYNVKDFQDIENLTVATPQQILAN